MKDAITASSEPYTKGEDDERERYVMKQHCRDA